jgi:hypothetical protein
MRQSSEYNERPDSSVGVATKLWVEQSEIMAEFSACWDIFSSPQNIQTGSGVDPVSRTVLTRVPR